MARTLGPAAYGGFGIGLNATTVLSKFFALGTVPATQYYASKKTCGQSDFIKTVLLLTLAISAVVMLVSFGILPWALSSYWQKQTTGYGVYLGLASFIPIIMLTNSLSIVLIPWGKIRQYTVIQLIGGVLIPILFGLFLLFFPPLSAAVISQAAIWVLSFACNVWYIKGSIGHGLFQKTLAEKILSYGLKTWPNVILSLGAARIAVLIGAAFISEARVGLFIVALNLSEAIFGFHSTVGQLLLSEVSEKETDSFPLVQRVMRFSSALFLAMGVMYFAVGKYLVQWFFGDKYSSSFSLSLILLGTGLAHAFHRVLSNFLAGMGFPSRNTITLCCEVAMLAILVPLLSSNFDVQGLAVASAASALFGLIISTIQSLKIMKCRLWDLYGFTNEDFVILIQKIKGFTTRSIRT
jgi:O-antigen/teichoic acid export membrane protein